MIRVRSTAATALALAVIVFYLMQKVLADITHGDNGLWFLTNLSPTPVLDLTRPNEFFIFACWQELLNILVFCNSFRQSVLWAV